MTNPAWLDAYPVNGKRLKISLQVSPNVPIDQALFSCQALLADRSRLTGSATSSGVVHR